MSLTKEALQHLSEQDCTGTSIEDGRGLILGDHFKVEDMERFQNERRRFRGKFVTESVASFIDYVALRVQPNLPVFIDRERMSARCYIDIGNESMPGHCDHSATLTLPKTPEFKAFEKANGASLSQDDLVELIEDWGHLLTFANSAGEVLERGKVLAAVRKISIDDLTQQESDRQDYSGQTSVMNSVKVNNADRLPATITWRLNPYEGLVERELTMRMSILTKGPAFRLRAVSLEAVEQDIAREFADLIEAALDECDCLVGTFSP